MNRRKKIVLIGPESTGKSTLCQQLASEYQTDWVPEYAREYLLTHGKDYRYEDLLTIAKGQLAGEDRLAAAKRFAGEDPLSADSLPPLFIDTDCWVLKVWCEFVFGRCHPWILEQIASREYDLYLLCNTDLPWVKDELREYPDPETRRTLFLIYQDILLHQHVPWVLISGDEKERFRQALEAVKKC